MKLLGLRLMRPAFRLPDIVFMVIVVIAGLLVL
jgi:hypothetical protein